MSATLVSAARRSAILPAIMALVVGVLALGLLFLPECRAAGRVWMESTAYGHCFLVGPIAAYLAWERRDRLRGLTPRPSLAFVLLGVPLGLGWFAAERLGIMEGRQLMALGFVELLFLTVLGWRMARVLSAPLAYLVFLVPFGAFVTPLLQSFTARFIDIGLTVLGVPHFANDMVIEISAGTFLVAEACAGLRFLIAAVAFGVFYALLNYRSPVRRLSFIAISIIVPILANGIRALGIVLLGQVLGSAEAAAADHVIYGWVFFSIVMLLLVVAGLPLREGPAGAAPQGPGVAVGEDQLGSGGGQPWPALIVLVLAGLAPAAASALDRYMAPPVLAGLPSVMAPDGCALASGDTTTDRALYTIRCGDRLWSLALQAVPARSTGSGLSEARNRLAGPVAAEDATVTQLRGTAPNAGSWQLVVSREPEHIAATAAWVHGRPAPGGLSQRLMQARDSVFGNDVPPLLMALTTRPTRSLSEAELEAVQAELRRILAAQPDLDAEVARLVRAR